MFKSHSDEKYWEANSSLYDILKVVQFCNSEAYIKKAALYEIGILSATSRFTVDNLFFSRFNKLPVNFREAIQKNVNLNADFFEKIKSFINWSVICENKGVDISFFANNMSRFSAQICKNPKIREDVYNLFSKSAIEKALTREQLIACPFYEDAGNVEIHTEGDVKSFVSRFLRRKNVQQIDDRYQDTEYKFWKSQFEANPDMCAAFCDCEKFIITNKNILNWSEICANPKVKSNIIRMRYFDIDKSSLLSRERDIDPFIYSFSDSYTDQELFKRYTFVNINKNTIDEDKKSMPVIYISLCKAVKK